MSRAVACCVAILSIPIAVAACGGHGHAPGHQASNRPSNYLAFPAWLAADAVASGSHVSSATCTRTAPASWGCRVVVSGRIRSAACRRQFGNRVICEGRDRRGEPCFVIGTPTDWTVYIAVACTKQ